ncbi:hypothetical protein FQN55_004415 [Onygenales sp. PD_40]|nr:hypothetical protein FQN55_004415 [Onygenales sp. PD_40]
MPLFKVSLAGLGYMILNFLRAMNIGSLLLIIAASGVMLAKTNIETNFFFFDSFIHVVVAGMSGKLIFLSDYPLQLWLTDFMLAVGVLFCTELSLFADYFSRNWPLYGRDSGFVAFGATMGLLGMSTLASLNTKANSEESMGLAFWRTVLGAGILAIIFGILSILVSFIFRDRRLGVTARHVRAHGAVAAQKVDNRNSSAMTSSRNSDGTKPYSLNRQSPCLPIYNEYTSHVGRTPSSTTSSTLKKTTRFPVNISSPMNHEAAQFATVEGSPSFAPPQSAIHPALRGGEV